jgi:hypothetical protein
MDCKYKLLIWVFTILIVLAPRDPQWSNQPDYRCILWAIRASAHFECCEVWRLERAPLPASRVRKLAY